MKKRTLMVVPNPYSALDADGRPQGVTPMEFQPDLYVGASVDIEESRRTGKFVFNVGTDAVEVPATAYYMRRIQDRALLPADLETAKYVGIEAKAFENPEAVLEKERDRASEAFESSYGHLPSFALQPKSL